MSTHTMGYHACRCTPYAHPMHTLCTPLEGAPAPSCEHAMRLYTMSAAAGMAAKDFGGALVK